jgi:hypothetical protein
MRSAIFFVVLNLALTFGQESEFTFDCANAEPNGFFSDPEQCDLYYECVDGVSTVKLCPDGLMFDDTNKIDAKCDYPFNVDCGKREYVQEPETGIDERCYRANGFFNHEKEDECNKFYNCVHGKAYELPCATSLIFDEEVGTCVRPEQASEHAKVCPEKLEKDDISGFSCPDEKTLGPHGQPLAHPSFPHPLSCQKFITCYFSKDIKELGCMKGQVFNYNTLKCVDPDVGPEDCKCWYECDQDISKNCPTDCLSNCKCPGAGDS